MCDFCSPSPAVIRQKSRSAGTTPSSRPSEPCAVAALTPLPPDISGDGMREAYFEKRAGPEHIERG